MGMVPPQGGEDYSAMRAAEYAGGIKDDGGAGGVQNASLPQGMQLQQQMTFIPNPTPQIEGLGDPSMVVERFLTCRKCNSTDMIFRKLYHPDPPLEIYSCAHCSQQIALCRVCGAQMNAVGGHLRRHMQRHEKAMMQNSMGFAMVDKNALIKVEPVKPGQAGGQAQGMQSATIFTIPSSQLQGQMISGDGSSFGIMTAQGMKQVIYKSTILCFRQDTDIGMPCFQDGISIEGLSAVGGKEAPVRVAPGRACMRCAYIKVPADSP